MVGVYFHPKSLEFGVAQNDRIHMMINYYPKMSAKLPSPYLTSHIIYIIYV